MRPLPFKAAAFYDKAIHEMGEQNPRFGADRALPFYVGVHRDTLADVTFRDPSAFAPPQAPASPLLEAPVTSSSNDPPPKSRRGHRGRSGNQAGDPEQLQQKQQPPRGRKRAAAGAIQPYAYASTPPAPKPAAKGGNKSGGRGKGRGF